MAISAKEFLAGQNIGGEKCAKCENCGIVLQETITGNRAGSNGRVCSDCYFKELGEVVEKYPIGTLRVRRGG